MVFMGAESGDAETLARMNKGGTIEPFPGVKITMLHAEHSSEMILKDDSGKVSERKYKLNTPIVRRVLAPGEQKEAPRAAPRPASKRRRR